MPDGVFEGITQLKLPEVAVDKVPMLTGLPKLPDELLSWAVKTLDDEYTPLVE